MPGVADNEIPTLGGRPLAPLTARSVVASVLLGTEPPVMSAGALVQSATLFGLAEGAVRTAMSRMVAKGELSKRSDGRYELAGHLVARQAGPATRAIGDHAVPPVQEPLPVDLRQRPPDGLDELRRAQ